MAKKEKASLTEAVSAELKKGFSLDKFKEKKLLKSIRDSSCYSTGSKVNS
jgi:hypothetical protein